MPSARRVLSGPRLPLEDLDSALEAHARADEVSRIHLNGGEVVAVYAPRTVGRAEGLLSDCEGRSKAAAAAE